MDKEAIICRVQFVSKCLACSSLVLSSSCAIGDSAHLEAKPEVEAGLLVTLAKGRAKALSSACSQAAAWLAAAICRSHRELLGVENGSRQPQVGILKSHVSFEREPGLGASQAVALSRGPDGTCFSMHSMV